MSVRLGTLSALLLVGLGLWLSVRPAQADGGDLDPPVGINLSLGQETFIWDAWRPGASIAQLWRELSDDLRAVGVNAVWKWDGTHWAVYATDRSGRPAPGSTDFPLLEDQSLWTSVGQLELWVDPDLLRTGHRAGIRHDRAALGNAAAPILIRYYGEFL